MARKTYSRYVDVPKLTRMPNYRVDMGWSSFFDQWMAHPEYGDSFDLDPDFQREHVWTAQQQVKWIEYQIRGGHYAKDIYFNCPVWMAGFNHPVVLVDGKQRIEAARRFLNNEIKAFGTYYDDWEGLPMFAGLMFSVNVNTLKTRAEVLQWYIDLNAGGTPHSPDEIRRVKRLLRKERAVAAARRQARLEAAE